MVKLIVMAASTVFMLGLLGAAQAQGMASPGSAQASSSDTSMRKPCDDLRAEIDAKIKKNGVPMFTLDVIDMDAQVTEGKVVGTCDGQTKKIVYKRG
jgi:hypothetical protein